MSVFLSYHFLHNTPILALPRDVLRMAAFRACPVSNIRAMFAYSYFYEDRERVARGPRNAKFYCHLWLLTTRYAI